MGGDETLRRFGMAHAQEHMAFRGCGDVSADQIAAIFAQLGGRNDNADTQQLRNILRRFRRPISMSLCRHQAACLHRVGHTRGRSGPLNAAPLSRKSRAISPIPTYRFIEPPEPGHVRRAQLPTPTTHSGHQGLVRRDDRREAPRSVLQDRWYAPRQRHSRGRRATSSPTADHRQGHAALSAMCPTQPSA